MLVILKISGEIDNLSFHINYINFPKMYLYNKLTDSF